jgi:hypothetical protein
VPLKENAPSAGLTAWTLLLLWTSLILAANVVFAFTTWRQHAAVTYLITVGKIAQSSEGQGPLGKRGLHLRYTYAVHGVNYSGSRYRYDDENVSLHYGRIMQDFPTHSTHPVYYNPRDPRDSTLAPGVDGCDLLLLLVALPFNVITAVVWKAFLNARPLRRSRREAGGVKIMRRERRLKVRLAETSAVEAGSYAAGLGAIVGATAAVFSSGFSESLEFMTRVWIATLLLGVAVGVWKHLRNASGKFDLHLDAAPAELILPQTAGRPAPLRVTRAALRGVIVQRRVSATPSGNHYSYVPALRLTEGDIGRTAPLVTWGWNEAKARAFGEWLSRELGAEFDGVQDETAPPAPAVTMAA